jgi:hypothetical protein
MTEPRTEAGRALLAAIQSGVAMLFAHDDGPDDPSPIPATILAIEAEAVAAERARLRAAVLSLGMFDGCGGVGCVEERNEECAAVLALLEPD